MPPAAPVEHIADASALSAATAADIDWGVVDSQEPEAEIDWDAAVEAVPMVDSQQGAVEVPCEVIDWDISVEDGAVGQEQKQHVAEVETTCTASVAAVRLAEDASYRACLTDDVLELLAFLKTRLAAMQRSGSEALPLGVFWYRVCIH